MTHRGSGSSAQHEQTGQEETTFATVELTSAMIVLTTDAHSQQQQLGLLVGKLEGNVPHVEHQETLVIFVSSPRIRIRIGY